MINTPSFLIHGKQDEVINYTNAIKLKTIFTDLIEWYPKKANHYNITTLYRNKIYSKIKFFLNRSDIKDEVKNIASEINIDILKNHNRNRNMAYQGYNGYQGTQKVVNMNFEENFFVSQKVNSWQSGKNCFDSISLLKNELSGVASSCSTFEPSYYPFEKKGY